MSKLRLGIVGENISYTLSPRIFEWAFARMELDAEYRVYDLPADRAEAFIRGGEWDGLSVTVPHKTLAWNCCEGKTEDARKASAANCLIKIQGEIGAENTDVRGCRSALAQWNSEAAAILRTLIIGSGGAARAARVAVTQSFPEARIALATRDPEQARKRLRVQLDGDPDVDYLLPGDASDSLSEFDLIIQATPVGSVWALGLPLPEPLRFKSGTRVLEMIYAPRDTAFMQKARKQGARVQNGIVMLIAQAGASFQRWTERPFPITEALETFAPEFGGEI